MNQALCQRRTAIDVAIAIGFIILDTGLTLLGGSWWPAGPGPMAWTLLSIQAVVCGSLVAWRRYPELVVAGLVAFTVAVSVAVTPEHDTVWAPLAVVVAAYAPIAAGRDRRTVLVSIAALALVAARPWDPSVTVIGIALLRTAIGPLIALYLDARRRLVRALTERAERAERERELEAERARADERARLAREMHDVVTHRVTLMVLQAGALRLTAPDEPTRQAAEELRAAGSQALEELRDLVGILQPQQDADDDALTSGLAALVAESSGVGTPAELVEEGNPRLASPVVTRTTYRIVREALTNVRKHAPGAQVVVRVRYDTDGVRLTVRNTAPTQRSDPALAGSGSGLGIVGLRRRIELVHGTLRAGPTTEGGFAVDATLPAYVPTPEPVS